MQTMNNGWNGCAVEVGSVAKHHNAHGKPLVKVLAITGASCEVEVVKASRKVKGSATWQVGNRITASIWWLETVNA